MAIISYSSWCVSSHTRSLGARLQETDEGEDVIKAVGRQGDGSVVRGQQDQAAALVQRAALEGTDGEGLAPALEPDAVAPLWARRRGGQRASVVVGDAQ